MLDLTRSDVLSETPPEYAGGCLVLFNPTHSVPCDWIPVDPWQEVLFGREAARQVGVVIAPGAATDTSVSRLHASLVLDHEGAFLVDLGSTNGTWLNGWRLPARRPARLHSGAHFRVGHGLFAWLDARPRIGPGGPAWLAGGDFERACEQCLESTRRHGGLVTLLSVRDEHGSERLAPDGVRPDWNVQLRSEDIVGRVGADEWAVLMPWTGLDLAGVVVGLMLKARAERSDPSGLRIGLAALTLPAPEDGLQRSRRPELATLPNLLACARSDRERHVTGGDGGQAVLDVVLGSRPVLHGPEGATAESVLEADEAMADDDRGGSDED